ncbi:MAG: phosphoribosylformylglycinamidine synthase subunit PurL [Candidatus Eiseniibacteriota bacterium]|nr:MAG: phosphoribosylformylglycinamidine synthase subunit PurL [Candidatus Eisenbacteria bacterium]
MRESSLDSEVKTLRIEGVSDEEVRAGLDSLGLRLTVPEARRLFELLKRNPSRVEATIFDIMWSEHCSYKSSKRLLQKYLPTEAPNVLLGPGEDAGIIELCTHEGERYSLVVAHESHNHPSQVLPFEGAATGIGGIVRDVYCMGADVVAVMDALRFGDPDGANKNKVREVASGVVSGIWQYGNALGVANLGGDVHFDSSYDENCLVNVIAIGVVKEGEIERSAVPEEAGMEDYDLVLVGKPTDASGFGGASFASDVLDSQEWGESRSAVQVPDPFLKRILAEANKRMLTLVHSRGLKIGFKDLGAGGIACATSEMVAASGLGATIDLEKVPLDDPSLSPEVIVCSETQERFALAVPSSITSQVLRIYNEEYELPFIYHGARAVVIGKVTGDGNYVLQWGGSRVCNVEARTITSGISVERRSVEAQVSETEPEFSPPQNMGSFLLEFLVSPNASSRRPVFSFYDCEVGGRTVVRPGDADAGVFAPVDGSGVGVAVAADGVPSYGKISPYWGGALAVAEAMRNVACVGATPRALSDCLNFGSPEVPEVFYQFEETLKGIGDCARAIWQKGLPGVPVPIVTGNVSFYNEGDSGRAVAPSPIVACFGLMEDYSKAVTMSLKESGSLLFLLGARLNELGGSLYFQELLNCLGKNVPRVRFDEERSAVHFVIEAIDGGIVASCHDISAGGLVLTLAEMSMASAGSLGVDVDVLAIDGPLRYDKKLFSESSGFVLEVFPSEEEKFRAAAGQHNVRPTLLGVVTGEPAFRVREGSRPLIELSLGEMRARWEKGLENSLA